MRQRELSDRNSGTEAGVVEKRYGKSQLDFERYAVLAVSSIYGIDILEDNVRSAGDRLFGVFDVTYQRFSRIGQRQVPGGSSVYS